MKKKVNLIHAILVVFPLLLGVQPLWSCFLLGMVCIVGIVHCVMKNKKLILPKGKNTYLLGIYLISFLVVSFYAVDKGMTFLAFFKNCVLLLFLVLWLQYTEKENGQKEYFKMISYSGVISVILSVIFILCKNQAIFLNQRLQGIFFYANSYGLFLLLGVIILLQQEKMNWKDIAMVVSLLIGIILTNSRAVIILTMRAMVAVPIIQKRNGKMVFTILLCFVIVFGGTYYFSKIEKRVNTEMLGSSEFVTRLLYYKDAIDMIKENPLGYGYEGWYYQQAKVQTGVYDSKFVHQSILQVALDVGVLPTIALVLLFGSTFFSKEQSKENRFLMVLILGHSMIDIDMEYMIFPILLCMMIPFEKCEKKKNAWQVGAGFLLFLVYGVLMVADSCYAAKNNDTAIALVPFHTDALQEKLYTTTSEKEQYALAQKIEKLNKNVSGVYEAFSNQLQKEKKYNEALEYEKKKLELNHYQMANYVKYTQFLSEALQYYNNKNDQETALKYAKEIVDVETKIKEVLEKTNPLCYQTIHPPRLEMPEELNKFILSVKEKISQEF